MALVGARNAYFGTNIVQKLWEQLSTARSVNPSDYAFQRPNHELRRHQTASTMLGHVVSKSGYHWFHWKVFLFELIFAKELKTRFSLISMVFHNIKSSSERISNSACTKRHVRHSDMSWVGSGTGNSPGKCFIWS